MIQTTKRQLACRELFLALLECHERLHGEFARLFRARGLTPAQFNVLRILRGAGGPGLPCQVIGERLIQRVPDVTRLVDRMERARLVTRERGADDRRVVRVKLTGEGRRLVDSLDGPVLDLHVEQAKDLSPQELEELTERLRALGRPS